MKKNGFTLVELLAVICILGIIMTIAAVSIFGSQSTALNKLSEEEQKNIKDAGKLIGIDLDDYTSEIYNCKTGSWIAASCTKDNTTKEWTSVKVTVENLVVNRYFTDTEGHCSGTITVTKSGSGYDVDIDSVSCQK